MKPDNLQKKFNLGEYMDGLKAMLESYGFTENKEQPQTSPTEKGKHLEVKMYPGIPHEKEGEHLASTESKNKQTLGEYMDRLIAKFVNSGYTEKEEQPLTSPTKNVRHFEVKMYPGIPRLNDPSEDK